MAPPTIVLEGVTLRHYAKDGTMRIGNADQVTFRRDKGQLAGTSVTVDVPPTPATRRGGAHLVAGTGEADLKGHRAAVGGGVHLTTGLGDDGRTESATWDQASDTVIGEKPVRVRGPGYATDADGFSFRVRDQRLDLAGGVRILSEPAALEAAE